MTTDIRWHQRLDQLTRALDQLTEAVELMGARDLSRLEKQGVIQAFEFTYELSWKTLKDYLVWQGLQSIVGSRDTIREAFNTGLVDDGEGWMAMLVDRNRTSHTYNEATAESILMNIQTKHYPLITALHKSLHERAQQ